MTDTVTNTEVDRKANTEVDSKAEEDFNTFLDKYRREKLIKVCTDSIRPYKGVYAPNYCHGLDYIKKSITDFRGSGSQYKSYKNTMLTTKSEHLVIAIICYNYEKMQAYEDLLADYTTDIHICDDALDREAIRIAGLKPKSKLESICKVNDIPDRYKFNCKRMPPRDVIIYIIRMSRRYMDNIQPDIVFVDATNVATIKETILYYTGKAKYVLLTDEKVKEEYVENHLNNDVEIILKPPSTKKEDRLIKGKSKTTVMVCGKYPISSVAYVIIAGLVATFFMRDSVLHTW